MDNKYNRNKEKIYQRSLDLIDEIFDNISDEEFLEDYLAGEQFEGPLAKDFITRVFYESFFVHGIPLCFYNACHTIQICANLVDSLLWLHKEYNNLLF